MVQIKAAILEDLVRQVDPAFDAIIRFGVGGTFVAVGPLMVLWGYFNRRQAATSAQWPTTEGVVVSSKVQFAGGGWLVPNQELRIRYRYTVDGREYSSDAVTPGGARFRSKDSAQRVAARYPEGGRVTVYYKPGQPRTAVLEPGGKSYGSIYEIIIGVGVFSFLFGLYWLLTTG